LQPLCLGREPKARVAIVTFNLLLLILFSFFHFFYHHYFNIFVVATFLVVIASSCDFLLIHSHFGEERNEEANGGA